MTDPIDIANELAERERATALANLRNKPTACSLTHCEDCGEVIDEQRRKFVAGCCRCIDCQRIFEHKAKAFAKDKK